GSKAWEGSMELPRDERRMSEQQDIDPSALGPNMWLIDEIYRRYREDPDSVGEQWREFFEDFSPKLGNGDGQAAPPTQEAPPVPQAPQASPQPTPAPPPAPPVPSTPAPPLPAEDVPSGAEPL